MPVLDLTYGRAELIAVRDAIARDDAPALAAALVAGDAGDAGDGGGRADRVELAAQLLGDAGGKQVAPLVERLVSEHHDEPGVLALRGAVESLRAYRIRGSGAAQLTRDSRLLGFTETLQAAEQYCRQATTQDPGDPTPWVWLLSIASGQEVDGDERVRRWSELARRAPGYFYGHYSGVSAFSPVWGCPPALMYVQVRSVVDAAADGTALPALLLAAHVEQWRVMGAQHDPMFQDKELRAEAEGAAARLPMRAASTPSEYLAHSFALAWFVKTKQWKLARRHRGFVGQYCVPTVWRKFGPKPLLAFRSFRTVAKYPFLGY